MHRTRRLLAAAAVLAIAVPAAGVPASAAPGKSTIGIVNGVPGKGRVDLCINGREIRSRVRYGGRTYVIQNPGTKVIKVFKADPRRCRGAKLGQTSLAVAPDSDYTVVFVKQSPKFVIFGNPSPIGDIPAGPGDPYTYGLGAWRHAADLGNATLKYQIANAPAPIEPTVDPIWTRGQQRYLGPMAPGSSWRLAATRPDKSWVFARSPWVEVEASRRYEWILLGTRPKNAKFIVWSRPIVEPPL